jgi:hypothetical protein
MVRGSRLPLGLALAVVLRRGHRREIQEHRRQVIGLTNLIIHSYDPVRSQAQL